MIRRRRPMPWLSGLLTLAVLAGCTSGAAPIPPSVSAAPPAVAAAEPRVDSASDLRSVPRRTPAPAAPEAMPPIIQPPPLEPFAMNLFAAGDFVPQHTFEWCVAASVQMAWNMVKPDTRSSYEDQQVLWEQARDRSNNPYRGADPGGWAQLLTDIGLGPYELVSVPDYADALRVAAAALRETGRPVGLVMWRGRHAWVMNGFESMGDPSLRPDFQITGINVVDPLYPYGSGTWGPSPEPNQLLSPETLAKQFVFREQRRWSSHIPAGFLLVLPRPTGEVAAADVTGGTPPVAPFVPFDPR